MQTFQFWNTRGHASTVSVTVSWVSQGLSNSVRVSNLFGTAVLRYQGVPRSTEACTADPVPSSGMPPDAAGLPEGGGYLDQRQLRQGL